MASVFMQARSMVRCPNQGFRFGAEQSILFAAWPPVDKRGIFWEPLAQCVERPANQLGDGAHPEARGRQAIAQRFNKPTILRRSPENIRQHSR